MELPTMLLLGTAIVAVLLLPPYVVGRARMAKARSMIAHDPHLVAGFTLAAPGSKPVQIYLGVVAAVAVIGLVVTLVISAVIEPLVLDNWQFMFFILVFWCPPILLAVILIGMLVSFAAASRARSRYLDDLARQSYLPEQARAGVTAAAEVLRGGRGLIGVAGTAAIAAIACLFLGLGWVALLFSAAGSTIQCARSSKCL